nr:receptor-like protein 9DC3 [Ziziphus jujuba var. spinosa]
MMNISYDNELAYMGGQSYRYSVQVTIKDLDIKLVRITSIFTTIDFSSNRFQGEIPSFIGKLKSLKGLNFSHNKLTGSIPSSLGNLTNLEGLDLSSNELVGEIPRQMADLTSLEVLSLSHNHLMRRIPRGKQFNTF